MKRCRSENPAAAAAAEKGKAAMSEDDDDDRIEMARSLAEGGDSQTAAEAFGALAVDSGVDAPRCAWRQREGWPRSASDPRRSVATAPVSSTTYATVTGRLYA